MVNMPSRKRRKSRTSSESSGLGQCLICLRQDSNESLITCQLCANQFHSVKCLHMLPKTVNRIPLSSWSCPKCKSCEICGRKTRALRSAAENNLLLCKGCDRGFHRNCIHHHTADDGLDLINESTWLCLNCEDKMASQGDTADESEEEEEQEEDQEENEVKSQVHFLMVGKTCTLYNFSRTLSARNRADNWFSALHHIYLMFFFVYFLFVFHTLFSMISF